MHESAKPIVPDCMAMILPPQDRDPHMSYAIVHIINRDDYGPGWWHFETDDDFYWIEHESQLMRLDDPDLQKQIEAEKHRGRSPA